MLGVLFVILPAHLLWILTWLKAHTAPSWFDGFYSAVMKTLFLWVVCFPTWVYFWNWKTLKDSISCLSIVGMKRGATAAGWFFILKWNGMSGVMSPRRCWGSFRSGAAWQPWSRNCFDAAASSSTARLLACSSWPPPSAPTRAPRGQTSAGNMLLKETC